ncbi:MAG: YfhO family protein [Ferruginibacter sp.]
MKSINFKKLLPHLVAIGVFLLVAVIFCRPALEADVVMQQGDYTAAEAMKHQSYEYEKIHGDLPLWVSNMFCGMPAFNIIFNGPETPFKYVDKLFQLWLPKPMNFFFLACICFYFLCLTLKIRPYIAILGGIAFAYSTYDPIIIVAGHDTKMLAMAYAPALIGAVILIFEKQYLSGFILTGLFASLHITQNHQQISYYVLLTIVVMGIFYLIKWIKAKETAHIAKAIPLAIGGALLGVLTNAIILFPVADFAKYSKRGGQLVMNNRIDNKTNTVKDSKTVGLTKEYALDWSYGKIETFSLLFQGVKGHGTHFSQRDGEYSIFPKLSETSNVAQYFGEKLNLPEDQIANVTANLSSRIYWGDKTFTTGSVYLGAVICALFVLGLFFLDDKHKWWILSASIVGIILAWGKHLPGINYFLFDHLPLYNKFRTPEMALVIPQLMFPLMAALTVEAISSNAVTDYWKKFKLGAITLAAIFAIATGLYFTMDYSKENKQRTKAMNEAMATQDATTNEKIQAINEKYPPETDNRVYEDFLYQTKGDADIAKAVVSALRKDRASFFGKDIVRSFVFVALTLLLVALYYRKTIGATVLWIAFPFLTAVDLLPIGMEYINAKSFENVDKQKENEFPMSNADQIILKDKDPNFRVLNYSGGDPFQDAKTSYHHKSVGGYHPAKLGIFDDLIAYQLTGQPNPAVVNMLNTKYFIQNNQEGNNTVPIPNTGALGNCWFVKGVKWVNGPAEEMTALNSFNPADTAVVDNSFKTQLAGFVAADSTSSIKQTAFENMKISYESNSSQSNVAVFSEIYYKDWKATIDGKAVPIAKANYVLRALLVPAGKHTIEFTFEPTVFKTSYKISAISNWVLFAMVIGFLVYIARKKKEIVA